MRPDGWRGIQPRENTIKSALFDVLDDDDAVERIFRIVEKQKRILMAETLKLGAITAEVVKKHIRNVHLSVYPPNGRVRIAAPLRMNTDTIRVFAISKLTWIRQQQKKMIEQDRESPRDYVERESHYVRRRRYLMTLGKKDAAPRVELRLRKIILQAPPSSSNQGSRSAADREMGTANGSSRGIACTSSA